MSNKSFDPETERYMVDYMNQGHPASIRYYAMVYGEIWDAEGGNIAGIDKEGMDIDVELKDGEKRVRIEFDHVLEDEEDAQNTLIDMSVHAREVVMSRAEKNRQQ